MLLVEFNMLICPRFISRLKWKLVFSPELLDEMSGEKGLLINLSLITVKASTCFPKCWAAQKVDSWTRPSKDSATPPTVHIGILVIIYPLTINEQIYVLAKSTPCEWDIRVETENSMKQQLGSRIHTPGQRQLIDNWVIVFCHCEEDNQLWSNGWSNEIQELLYPWGYDHLGPCSIRNGKDGESTHYTGFEMFIIPCNCRITIQTKKYDAKKDQINRKKISWQVSSDLFLNVVYVCVIVWAICCTRNTMYEYRVMS